MKQKTLFKNKSVVVTGGTDGIGKALVQQFLNQRATVFTCGRNEDKLYELQKNNVGRPLHVFRADVSNEMDCKHFIEFVLKTANSIDILVNNAGITMKSMFVDTSLSALKKVVDTNYWGVVYCTHFAIQSIIKNKGSVVSISSIAGFRGLPGRNAYCASKFAVNGFMETLRTELLKQDVQVLLVSPGFTQSNIRNVALNKDGVPQNENTHNEENMMSAETSAQYIIQAIRKRKKRLTLSFLGKFTILLNKIFPDLCDQLVYKTYIKNNQLIK